MKAPQQVETQVLVGHELAMIEIMFMLHEAGVVRTRQFAERFEWTVERMKKGGHPQAIYGTLERLAFGLRNASQIEVEVPR